jgi:hypothetical protein
VSSLTEKFEAIGQVLGRFVEERFEWLGEKSDVSWLGIQIVIMTLIVIGVIIFFVIVYPLLWLNEFSRTIQRFWKRREVPCRICFHSKYLHSYEEVNQNGGGKKPFWMQCQKLCWYNNKAWTGIGTCSCKKYEPMTNLEYMKAQK